MPTLGTIATISNQQDSYQPLLVAAVVFADSPTAPTVRLYSSHALNASEGNQPTGINNFPYNNHDFDQRIKNGEIAASQALSADGIDITPTISLQLVDSDKACWADEYAIGFKGAQLTMYFIYWDVGTSAFSSDSRVIFTGICDPAKAAENILTVKATNRMNMNQSLLPLTKLSRRCGSVFTDTTGMTPTEAAALHQEAADNRFAQTWRCGYSVLASGANARGNAPSGDICYRSCNLTLGNCIERLGNPINPGGSAPYSPYNPVEYDGAGRKTARYSGFQWDNPTTFRSRGFGQAKPQNGFNALNEGKYNDYVPMGWGTYWVDPIVINIVGDANYTEMEVLVGAGSISNIRHVICNDIDVDKLGIDAGTQQAQIALQLFWDDLTTGDRSGACNGDKIYDRRGDPYGGLRVIKVHVPSQLTPSSSIPRIRVLCDGPKIRKYANISSISVSTGMATVTIVGINRDIAVASGSTLSFSISGNTKSDINGDYDVALPNFTSGPPGTFEFATGASNGTGIGGRVAYEVFSTSPAWIIMDVLNKSGWPYTSLDLDSFISAGDFYDSTITYNGISGYVDVASDGVTVTQVSGNDFSRLSIGGTIYINGVAKIIATISDSNHLTITGSFGGFLNNVSFLSSGTDSHARFKMGFSLSQRTSSSDLLRQLRMGCRSLLRPSVSTGLLQLIPEQTLGLQQPSPMVGSNYNTAIKSVDASGASANGYVAWKFDYGSILPNGDGTSSFEIDQLDIKNCPNKIGFEFMDEDNQYQSDSINLINSQDVIRVSRPVEGQISAAGIMNYDQAERCMATWLAKLTNGNPRRDTGGTYTFTFQTSFKCINLQCGDIVLVDYPQYSINDSLVTGAGASINGCLARVISIKPSHNFRTAQISLQFHSDLWYVDTFGQSGVNQNTNYQFRNSLTRPPFPWSPNYQQPLANDALYAREDWQMAIRQKYDTSASSTPLARVILTGNLPINTFAGNGLAPPMIASQGSTAPTGGTVPAGRRYYGQLCGYDSNGNITTPSNPNSPCAIDVPAGANTATLTFPVTRWPVGTVSYALFVGLLRTRMTAQVTGPVTPTSTPSSITITSYKENTWGIPDVEFNSIGINAKLVVHAGVIGYGVLSVTSTTIKIALPSDNNLSVNQFAPSSGHPYYIMLLGLAGNSYALPIANWAIVSNTGDTFTISGIDPTTIDRGDGTTGLHPGDAIIITMRPTVGSDGGGNYIQDTNWVNNANDYLTSSTVTGATNTSPVVVTTTSDEGVTTGSKVYLQNILGNTAANGPHYAKRLTAFTYELYSNASCTTPVAGNGTYTSGGRMTQQREGLQVDADKGDELYCAFGTGAGTYYKVKSNTKDKIYIEGDWTVTPDASSVFFCLGQSFIAESSTDNINSNRNNIGIDFDVSLPNYSGRVVMIQALTFDGGGNSAFRPASPWRMIYVYGVPLSQKVVTTTPYAVDSSDDVITFADGSAVVNLPPLGSMKAKTLWLINATTSTDLAVNAFDGETVEGVTQFTLYCGSRHQLMPNA